MTFSSRGKSCRSFFRDFSLLTVPSLYIFRCLMFLKNNLEILENTQHEHGYNTRFCRDFQYPRHRLTLFQKTPLYMARKLFNHLPSTLKSIIKEDKFKRELKSFLINKTFYSIQEFFV